MRKSLKPTSLTSKQACPFILISSVIPTKNTTRPSKPSNPLLRKSATPARPMPPSTMSVILKSPIPSAAFVSIWPRKFISSSIKQKMHYLFLLLPYSLPVNLAILAMLKRAQLLLILPQVVIITLAQIMTLVQPWRWYVSLKPMVKSLNKRSKSVSITELMRKY